MTFSNSHVLHYLYHKHTINPTNIADRSVSHSFFKLKKPFDPFHKHRSIYPLLLYKGRPSLIFSSSFSQMPFSFKINKFSATQIRRYETGLMTSNRTIFGDGSEQFTATVICKAGVIDGQFGYNIPVKFVNNEDYDKYMSAETLAQQLCPEGVTFLPKIKEDEEKTMFIKVGGAGEWSTEFSPTILPVPEQFEEGPIQKNTILNVAYTPNLWMNLNKKQCGVYMDIAKIEIDNKSL